MTSLEKLYVGNHRRQQSLVLVASILCLLLAIAPRQERALFITEGPVKAFGATFPPIIPARLLFPPSLFGGNGTPAAFFARTPPIPRLVPAGAPPAPPAAQPPAAPAISIPNQPSAPFGNSDSFLPNPAPPPPGGRLPFIPTSFSPPGTTPVGSVPPDTPPTSPPTTGTPDTPVSPVPEPASWLMLIAGFALTGAALRRKRPGAAISNPAPAGRP